MEHFRAPQRRSTAATTLQTDLTEAFLNSPEQIQITKQKFKLGRLGVGSITLRPEVMVDETPILIVKGFTASRGAYLKFAYGLASHGREVRLYGTNRKECLLKNPLTQQAKVAWGVMQATGMVDEFDVIGHSMGTPISAKLGAEKGQHVRSIMTTGGAGMHGDDPFWHMAYKLGKTGAVEAMPNLSDLHRNTPDDFLVEQGMHIFRNLPLLVREGVTTALVDSRPDLEAAKDKGVRIGAFLFENDTFFPPSDVLENSGYLFDFHQEIPGALHVHPQLYPIEHANEQVQGSRILNTPSYLAA